MNPNDKPKPDFRSHPLHFTILGDEGKFTCIISVEDKYFDNRGDRSGQPKDSSGKQFDCPIEAVVQEAEWQYGDVDLGRFAGGQEGFIGLMLRAAMEVAYDEGIKAGRAKDN